MCVDWSGRRQQTTFFFVVVLSLLFSLFFFSFFGFFLNKCNNIHVTKCLSCLGLCRENGRCVNLGLSNPLHITCELYPDPAELHSWGSVTLVAAVGLLNDLEVRKCCPVLSCLSY